MTVLKLRTIRQTTHESSVQEYYLIVTSHILVSGGFGGGLH